MKNPAIRYLAMAIAGLLCGCASHTTKQAAPADPATPVTELYGTLEPMASDAVYFVLTDRFVNGDPSNDQREQGVIDGSRALATFDRPTPGGPAGASDNVGYLGGDFRGLLDHADYIRDLGFGAVWLTPIVDNPDQAFTGGAPVVWKGAFTDGGKTGYHGYWGVNFFKLDEHLPSADLDFRGLTAGLKQHGVKTVLDIVANHGSPAFSMPKDQPKFGEIYDAEDRLIADHQNLPGEKLDPKHNPLHRFYAAKKAELAQLSDTDENSPEVLAYFTRAYLHWIEQGADAFRIDTIRHMKHEFWRDFSAKIRAQHPGFFMFGESYDYQAEVIAKHTLPENGGVSVLDFPLKAAFEQTFAKNGSYAQLDRALYLENGPYQNPYELMSFYDNHDMPRFAGSDRDFINAHNFLFTARGIPVLYYGSEVGFMRGTAEHEGNRNYFGADQIRDAPSHPIYQALRNIARQRAASVALQRGLQLNLLMRQDQAAFLRVYQHEGVAQTALVLLNKSDQAASVEIDARVPAGSWQEGTHVVNLQTGQRLEIPANGVRVLLSDKPISDPVLLAVLKARMH